jgi:hypothetical protein
LDRNRFFFSPFLAEILQTTIYKSW